MARIESQKKHGKIDGVILYTRNGIQYVRSMPAKVSNPRSPKQMQNRKQFGGASKLASSLLKELIHPYWNLPAKKIKRIGYNYFVTSNLPVFKNGDFVSKKLILCPDNGLVQEAFWVEKKGDLYKLSWGIRPSAKSARETDDLCILIFSEEKGLIISENRAKRGDHQLEIENVGGINQHYFVFWKREGLWSESQWVFSVRSE